MPIGVDVSQHRLAWDGILDRVRFALWHPLGSVGLRPGTAAALEEHARRAGPDPASIAPATNLSLSKPGDGERATALALAGAGFSYLIASWPAQGRPRVEEFVHRRMPVLAAR